MKKVITIIVLILAVGAGAVYFLFLAPPPEPETIFYVPGDYFVTNIKDSSRLLKTTIVFELSTTDPSGDQKYLTEHNHMLRDIIVFTLRSYSEDELRAEGIQDELRREIVEKLREQMNLDYIQTIYFNDYVIQ